MAWIAQRMISFSPHRRLCTGVSELVARSTPCLMVAPSFEGGREDFEYNLYSVGNGEVVKFKSRGGKEESEWMRDKNTRWVGASLGWLALFDNYCGDMCLLNPVSGRLVELPPFSGKPFKQYGELMYAWKLVISHHPDEEDCRALMLLDSTDRVAFCLLLRWVGEKEKQKYKEQRKQ